MKTKEVKLKLYLEGVETPFTSVQITEQLNSAAVAQFSVPPASRFARLWPKTLAHLFYRMKLPGDKVEQYYLIFEGELTNVGFDRNQSSRGISLTFNGLTSNWNSTYKTKVDFSLDTMVKGNYLMVAPDLTPGTQYEHGIVKQEGKKLNNRWYFTDNVPSNITSRFSEILKQYFVTEKSSNTEDGATPIYSTIYDFIKHLADTNPYYHLIHRVLKVADRFYVLENRTAVQNISDQVFSEFFTKNVQTMPPISTGSQILQMFLQSLQYQYVEAAAPTWNGEKPIGVYLSPDLSFSMPLRCNIIFPDQVLQSTYTQNFLDEPTRLVCQTPQLGLNNVKTHGTWTLQPRFVAPTGVLYFDEKGNPSLGISNEEFFRGINPQLMQYNQAQIAYASLQRKYLQPEGSKVTQTEDEDKKFIQELLKSNPTKYIRGIVTYEFLRRRYGSRTFQVVTPYTPTRLVGFPGMVMDKELPTVVGKIVNITSNLSAEGQGLSTVTFVYPRAYYDQIVGDISNEFDPYEEGQPLYDLVDNWPDTSFWLAEEEYANGENLMKTMQPLVYNLTDVPEEITPNDLNPTIEVYAEGIDYSNENSRKNTLIGLKAMQNLRVKYSAHDKEPHVFVDKETHRSLTEEKNFWNFLLGQDFPNDDSYRALSGVEFTPDEKGMENKFNEEAVKSPFILERRTQVLAAIGELK